MALGASQAVTTGSQDPQDRVALSGAVSSPAVLPFPVLLCPVTHSAQLGLLGTDRTLSSLGKSSVGLRVPDSGASLLEIQILGPAFRRCGLGHIAPPLCVSVSSFVKWSGNNIRPTELS